MTEIFFLIVPLVKQFLKLLISVQESVMVTCVPNAGKKTLFTIYNVIIIMC